MAFPGPESENVNPPVAKHRPEKGCFTLLGPAAVVATLVALIRRSKR